MHYICIHPQFILLSLNKIALYLHTLIMMKRDPMLFLSPLLPFKYMPLFLRGQKKREKKSNCDKKMHGDLIHL